MQIVDATSLFEIGEQWQTHSSHLLSQTSLTLTTQWSHAEGLYRQESDIFLSDIYSIRTVYLGLAHYYLLCVSRKKNYNQPYPLKGGCNTKEIQQSVIVVSSPKLFTHMFMFK